MKKFKIIMEVDDEKMATVLKFLHLRKDWAEIKQVYENWEDTFKENHFKKLGLEDLRILSEVFFFKGESLESNVNQFICFLRRNQQFYNDNIETVFNRMRVTLDAFNAQARDRGEREYPFINWLPAFGGKLQHGPTRNKAEYDWHRRNKVPFPLDGYVLSNSDDEEEERPRRRRGRPRKN